VGHFAIDIFNSMGPVLLTWLAVPLALTSAQIGLGVGLYQLLAGATQPVFGFIVDRVGTRFLAPLSVATTLCCVCLAIALGLGSGAFWVFLIPFALAAIGSGAFHPQGTLHAGSPISGRAATTTAVFFFFGQMGLASGPPLAGLALDRFGVSGIYGLALVLLPVTVFMALAMGSSRHNPSPRRQAAHSLAGQPSGDASGSVPLPVESAPEGGSGFTVALLAVVFSCRAWIFIGTAAFLPLLFQLKGWSSTRQGVVAGLFWLGGGVTGILAGVFADRFGRRITVAATTFIGALMLLLLPTVDGSQALLVALLTGAFLGAPHSVLMVMAQSLLPVRRGLASGMALGFLFAMGAVGSWGIGLLADRFALEPVLQAGSTLGFLAAALSLLLPRSR
jgi:FSR family fosmidomycin resistance protein-like MFS transporter